MKKLSNTEDKLKKKLAVRVLFISIWKNINKRLAKITKDLCCTYVQSKTGTLLTIWKFQVYLDMLRLKRNLQ